MPRPTVAAEQLSRRQQARMRHEQSDAELDLLLRKLTFLRELPRSPLVSELVTVEASLNRLRRIVSR